MPLGIRTRKGVSVKQNSHVSCSVASGPSRLNGPATDGRLQRNLRKSLMATTSLRMLYHPKREETPVAATTGVS